MHRAPAGLDDHPLPVGAAIRPVASDLDVAAWERVVFESNGGPPSRPGELHPAGSQRQPGLSLLLANVRGRPVGAALGLVTGSCVVVSAVAVLPAFRGTGLGTALTQRVLALAPGLPATLSSSEIGYGVYRRLAFVEVGRPIHWT
ncbi:GNAT family N-acetyltransferase [Ornithinimicrobium faecis]|uniref:GNAT family N-acetyltransferase n=1 Tax=Ornithinimicrobium faecis TaxID=2934158 RepID=UPI003CE556F0